MNLKIAVPWPSKKAGQQRIKDSLSLWDEKTLLLCLAEPCDEKFVNKYIKIKLYYNIFKLIISYKNLKWKIQMYQYYHMMTRI